VEKGDLEFDFGVSEIDGEILIIFEFVSMGSRPELFYICQLFLRKMNIVFDCCS
jgi:hypothetical protein